MILWWRRWKPRKPSKLCLDIIILFYARILDINESKQSPKRIITIFIHVITFTFVYKKNQIYSAYNRGYHTSPLGRWRRYWAVETWPSVNMQRFETRLYWPVTIAWSLSYGSRGTCSIGLNRHFCNVWTSRAKHTSGGAVESMQLAFIEMTAWPPSFRNASAFMDTIRAWSGCATSENTTSTWSMSIRYRLGRRASSTMANKAWAPRAMTLQNGHTNNICSFFGHAY
jgi:hypothetical protein